MVKTLEQQNKEILEELESHVSAHEHVRQKLDRKTEVARMMDTFNRDLMTSTRELQSHMSPNRFTD